MSKSCQEVIELMNLYLDGRLSGGQYQELAKHLESCEHCSKRMKYLRVISSEIRADRPSMPDDLHSNIMNYIAKANAPAPERKISFAKWKKPLAVCAAALVLLIAAPLALNGADGVDASNPAQTASGSWLSQLFKDWNLFGKEDSNKDPDSSATDPDQNDPVGDGADAADPGQSSSNESNKSEEAYTVPALHTNERFANYIVATGTVLDVSEYFDLRSIQVYPEEGSIYVYLPNNAGALAQVYASIRSMGLTLHLNLKGLPETDTAAPEILFLIFPK